MQTHIALIVASIFVAGCTGWTRISKPWMVGITNPDGDHICTGTLIAPNWVLTTQACHIGRNAFSSYTAMVCPSLNNCTLERQREYTMSDVRSRDRNSDYGNDIALVHLQEAVLGETADVGTSANVVSDKSPIYDYSVTARKLQWTTLKLLPDSDCNKNGDEVCADSRPAYLTQSDLGDPMMDGNSVVAVLSTVKREHCEFIQLSLGDHRDWIQSVMDDEESDSCVLSGGECSENCGLLHFNNSKQCPNGELCCVAGWKIIYKYV